MKADRHNRIVELVTVYNIETQEELAGFLRESGYDVTQATVSRDIRELGLIKVSDIDGKQRYSVAGHGKKPVIDRKYIHALKDAVVSVDKAENILVIKTVAGMAMAVAAAIDALNIPEIVGSIAGDDTIMCAVRRTDLIDGVIKELSEHIDNYFISC